jgi:hypothetical protein
MEGDYEISIRRKSSGSGCGTMIFWILVGLFVLGLLAKK